MTLRWPLRTGSNSNQYSNNRAKAEATNAIRNPNAIRAHPSTNQNSIGIDKKSSSAVRRHSALQLIFAATMDATVNIARQAIRQKSTAVSTTTIAGHMVMILVTLIPLLPATTGNRATLLLLTAVTTREEACSIKTNHNGHHIHEEVGENIIIHL